LKKDNKKNRLEFKITEECNRRFEKIREKMSKNNEMIISKSSLARMAIFLGLNDLEKELKNNVRNNANSNHEIL